MAFCLLDWPKMDLPELSVPLPGQPGVPPSLGKDNPMPGFLAIFTAKKPGKAEKALAKFAGKSGLQSLPETYQGVKLHRLTGKDLPGEIVYGIDGGLVLLGSKLEAVKAALDRNHGKGKSLAQLEAYQQIVNPLSKSSKAHLVFYYLNTQMMQKAMEKEPLFAGAEASMEEMKYLEAMGGILDISPDALQLESLTWGKQATQSPMRKILEPLGPVGGQAFEFLPKDTVIASSLPSPAAYWKVLQKALAPGFKELPFDPIAEMKKGLKEGAGLDLEQDILGWMTGEFDFGLFGVNAIAMAGKSRAMPLQASLIITGKDEATVTAKLARLQQGIDSAIAKSGGPKSTWQPGKTGAVNYSTLLIPGAEPFAPCFGQVGKLAVISLTPKGFEQTIAAGLEAKNSITTNDTYLKMKNFLPTRPTAIFFFESAAITRELGKMPPFNLLGAFKSVIGGEGFLPQGERSVVRMEVDFPQLIEAADSLAKMAENFGPRSGPGPGPKMDDSSCLSNVKQITLAMLMFADDHDEHLPKADRWIEDLMPYVRSEEVFKCPDDDSGARSSYAMNSALSGLALKEIKDPSNLVLVFETNKPGNNPAGGPEAVQLRHNNGRYAVYGYVDGHAKMAQKGENFNPKQ
jgi:prepilin-type processing-associated H-X9-DG protein